METETDILENTKTEIKEISKKQVKLAEELLSMLEKYSNSTLEQKSLSDEISTETKEAREQGRDKDFKKIGELKEKIEALKTKKKSYWGVIIKRIKDNKEYWEKLGTNE